MVARPGLVAMDWGGGGSSSWTCGVVNMSEYMCTPGNGATDLRECQLFEDSIVVTPREMLNESEKRFAALMGDGDGDVELADLPTDGGVAGA